MSGSGVRGEVRTLAALAEEDPLLGGADRYRTLRKFAPELLEALEFKAARSHDPTLSAIKLLQHLNRSGKREVPADAPMPFRKEWKRLVTEENGQPNRRLYETAVSRRCATGCAPATCGSSGRPITAASTAICCRPPTLPRSRPSWDCR